VDIKAPRERIWELLASPLGWGSFDPAIHDVRLNGPVTADTGFTWANGRARMKSKLRAALDTWLSALKTAAQR
jgi:hypothetical protein